MFLSQMDKKLKQINAYWYISLLICFHMLSMSDEDTGTI